MKLIFLDIDGVLNYQLMWHQKRQAERFKDLPPSAPDGAHDICTEKMHLLNSLIKTTGAKVVISSSWRHNRSVKDLQEVFDYCGFEGQIIDKTPSLSFNSTKYHYSVPRGCEIKAWLEMNKDILNDKLSRVKYVIFDDDSDMLYWQRHYYLRVDSYCGLTPNLIHRAKQILST